MHTINVFDGRKDYFVGGLFLLNEETQERLLSKFDLNSDRNTFFYNPNKKILVCKTHTDVWGGGFGTEYSNSLLTEKEKEEILKISQNWGKGVGLLKSIPHEHGGESYIYIGNLGLRFVYEYKEKIEKIIEKYPVVEQIIQLGIRIEIGEATISIK